MVYRSQRGFGISRRRRHHPRRQMSVRWRYCTPRSPSGNLWWEFKIVAGKSEQHFGNPDPKDRDPRRDCFFWRTCFQKALGSRVVQDVLGDDMSFRSVVVTLRWDPSTDDQTWHLDETPLISG